MPKIRPCAFFLLAALTGVAVADTLIFKDGRRMEGTVVEEDAETVTFRKGSIASKFRKDEIEKIVRGSSEIRETTESRLRTERLAPTGNAELDKLRGAVAAALDAVDEKRKALEKEARKVEAPTKAYEAQLKKVAAAESEAAKVRARLADAEAKIRKTEAQIEDAKAKTGRVPAPLKAELDERIAGKAATEKTLATALQRVEAESKALDDVTDRFQMSADSIRPAVQALSASIAAADKAWAALEGAEGGRGGSIAWWPAASAARVRLEGRVEGVTKDSVVLVTGSESDPSKWAERVTVKATEAPLKAGEVVIVRARREGTEWVLEGVER